MKLYYVLPVVGFYFTSISCSKPYTPARIEQTSRDIVHIIKTGEVNEFRDKIGVPIKDDDARFKRKFDNMKALFQKHVDETKLTVNITDSLESSGRRMVIVPIFHADSTDTSSDFKSIELQLYFGPPSMIYWNKISGYNLKVVPRF